MINTQEEQILVNIDTSYKLFVWLFPRTGTSLFTKVFEGYHPFKCFSIHENLLKLNRPHLVHHHYIKLFPGYENYKPIITARNPYSLMVSNFFLENKTPTDNEFKKKFLVWLEEKFFKNIIIDDMLENILYIEDFYPLRLENLKEDYYKLPNIHETITFKENKLNQLLETKVNSHMLSDRINYKDFYDKNSADLIYYNFINYFRIFEYDKNSWR